MPPTFTFCTTNLATLETHVSAPVGIVYSTNPFKALGENGKTYFTKGPDREVVFAEISGCLLAAAVGIPVPPVALCTANGEIFAGSEKVEQAFRDASIPLKRPQKIANVDVLYSVIAVDSWLGNTDRNMGNVLVCPHSDGKVELVMIDFEKSAALRPQPLIQSTLIEYQKLWPTSELGQRARELKPLYPPQAVLERIASMNEEKCRDVLRPLLNVVGDVAWANDSIGALANRAQKIKRIAEEVWRSS